MDPERIAAHRAVAEADVYARLVGVARPPSTKEMFSRYGLKSADLLDALVNIREEVDIKSSNRNEGCTSVGVNSCTSLTPE